MEPKVIAVIVGMLLCLSSSVSSAMSMGGGNDDSSGAGGGAGSSTTPSSTTFGTSTLPAAADATIVEPGFEWSHGTKIEPPNKSYNMVLQGDNNLCINEPGKPRGCLMSHQVGGTAKAFFQGDGNICVRNQANMAGDAKCYMSYSNDVPDGQHRLVLHNDGKVYVDHGTGESGRFDLVKFF